MEEGRGGAARDSQVRTAEATPVVGSGGGERTGPEDGPPIDRWFPGPTPLAPASPSRVAIVFESVRESNRQIVPFRSFSSHALRSAKI